MRPSIRLALLIGCVGPAGLPFIATAAQAADCAGLAGLKLADTRILEAEVVQGPNFTLPSTLPASFANKSSVIGNLPAFCRVAAMVTPAVNFEVWLPLTTWNGKFQGTGNGGYNGSVVYDELARGVRAGYATSSTDMGHVATAPDPGSWALGHPELVVDQAYRAQHETAVKSKQVIRAFYGKDARRSYFRGCSSGGWQGLTEAQRFPEDYDGIVAGAPAIDVIRLHAATIWNYAATRAIAKQKFQLVADAVVARCDKLDGVADGLLESPRRCDFAPKQLACKGGAGTAACLTPGEVSAFERLYSGAKFSSGLPVYPGIAPGAEGQVGELPPFILDLAASTFKNMVFDDPNWDPQSIDYDRDVRTAEQKIGATVSSNSPDLRAFRKRGGKLILYHGWHDPGIIADNTINYYGKVAAFMANPAAGISGAGNATAGHGVATASASAAGRSEPGQNVTREALGRVQDFARLFLLPGYGHCGGGPGPGTFDALEALDTWVEKGTAPDRILASHSTDGKVDRTRPLCPYPRVATYKGSGSTDDANNFACQEPPRP